MLEQLGDKALKAPASRKEVYDGLAQLVAALRQIDQRVRALETAPEKGLWAGIWCRGCLYPANVLCTHDGAIFYSLRDTDRQPTTPGSGWQLIHKTRERARR